MKLSPTRSVPSCTRIVATDPRPRSTLASRTVPVATRFGFAFCSSISVTSRIISSSPSRLSRFFAETGTVTVDPPQSSGVSPRSANSCLTRSRLALALSILLMATMIGTPAAFAWSIASCVCGITPSSAATTRMTMSVTLAPRARINVKRFVARRVEKDDLAAADLHRIRADVLRDAARLALGDLRLADGVEQGRLPVVDVSHDGDDRGADDQVVGTGLLGIDDAHLFLERPHFHGRAELPGDGRRRLGIERRVDGHHHAAFDQLLQDVLRLDTETLRQILDGHALGQRDGPRDRRRRRRSCRCLRTRPPILRAPSARAVMRSRRRPVADRRPRR